MLPLDHYREAERLLAEAPSMSDGDGYAEYLIAKAQIHATLATASTWPSTAR